MIKSPTFFIQNILQYIFIAIFFIIILNIFFPIIVQQINADNMIENEFVDECYEGDVELKSENNYWIYKIADKGSGFVESELLPNIQEQHKILLEQFKKKITDMPIKKLLYYVYTQYPEYTDKSLIKEEVLKNGN